VKEKKECENYLFDDKAKIRIWICIRKNAVSESMQYDDGVKARTNSGSKGFVFGVH
jgi:hypothetical protein